MSKIGLEGVVEERRCRRVWRSREEVEVLRLGLEMKDTRWFCTAKELARAWSKAFRKQVVPDRFGIPKGGLLGSSLISLKEGGGIVVLSRMSEFCKNELNHLNMTSHQAFRCSAFVNFLKFLIDSNPALQHRHFR